MTDVQYRCPVCNQFHETVQMNEKYQVLEPCASCQGGFWNKPDDSADEGEIEHFVITDHEEEDLSSLIPTGVEED
jgi:hypothetical protein